MFSRAKLPKVKGYGAYAGICINSRVIFEKILSPRFGKENKLI